MPAVFTDTIIVSHGFPVTETENGTWPDISALKMLTDLLGRNSRAYVLHEHTFGYENNVVGDTAWFRGLMHLLWRNFGNQPPTLSFHHTHQYGGVDAAATNGRMALATHEDDAPLVTPVFFYEKGYWSLGLGELPADRQLYAGMMNILQAADPTMRYTAEPGDPSASLASWPHESGMSSERYRHILIASWKERLWTILSAWPLQGTTEG